MSRTMKPIPISAGEKIAKEYGYDQVIIFARRVGDEPDPHGEHLTTYGINKTHCDVAARVGNFLKTKIMGWFKADLHVGRALAEIDKARQRLIDAEETEGTSFEKLDNLRDNYKNVLRDHWATIRPLLGN